MLVQSKDYNLKPRFGVVFLFGATSSCTLYLFMVTSKRQDHKKDAVSIWAKNVLTLNDDSKNYYASVL
ncbi:hypothetical protein [Flavobacterium sp. ALD4]|uniref:hypothetical protein n=1 Tax=Flavobacterium sp. ALD4 TaxID=2058314 RepID=UPI0012FF3734|nr:hypothetical protein [Flavobacterium sp. ALD4]